MENQKFADIIKFIRRQYPNVEGVIPLHAPCFVGPEKENLAECVDSTYVSYVGPFVKKFEEQIAEYTGARHAVAMVNGTAALFMILHAMGIGKGSAVITQALSFAATANAVAQTGAVPFFVDVDQDTFGMSPVALDAFLHEQCEVTDEGVTHQATGLKIGAVMPMHTFGMPSRIKQTRSICDQWGLPMVEDAAESLGSFIDKRHTGTFGYAAALSFNGNKPVTTGGGGMVLTNDDELAEKARHLSTTAKVPHAYEFFHDEVGYNLRLPNVNAALGCAQMDLINRILADKRALHKAYVRFFSRYGMVMLCDRPGVESNMWLNAVIFEDRPERDAFLKYAAENGVQSRPIWTLLSKLPMYEHCPSDSLDTSRWLEDRVVNLPSGARPENVLDAAR